MNLAKSVKLHLLLPTFNRAQILGDTLNMIMQQDAPSALWHLTVVDNCSNDATVNLLKQYESRYTNFNFLVNERNLGLFGNINRCMDLAESKKYMIIHSDDYVSNRLVSVALRASENFGETAMIFGPCSAHFSETGEVLKKWHTSSFLADHDREIQSKKFMTELITSGSNFIFPPTVIYDREFFSTKFRYDEKYRYTSDFKLWLDVAANAKSIGYYSDPLITCNIHEGRLSKENAKPMRLEYIDICAKYLSILKKKPTLHEMGKKTFLIIRIKLLIYSIAIQLNISPNLKTRRLIAKIFEKVSL